MVKGLRRVCAAQLPLRSEVHHFGELQVIKNHLVGAPSPGLTAVRAGYIGCGGLATEDIESIRGVVGDVVVGGRLFSKRGEGISKGSIGGDSPGTQKLVYDFLGA